MAGKNYLSKIVKSGNTIYIKDAEANAAIANFSYNDAYIGIGSAYTDVMVAANHYDTIYKTEWHSYTANNNKLWVIMPEAYSPALMLNGISVPLELDSTVTDDEVTYKVWKSSNSYTGSLRVFLL